VRLLDQLDPVARRGGRALVLAADLHLNSTLLRTSSLLARLTPLKLEKPGSLKGERRVPAVCAAAQGLTQAGPPPGVLPQALVVVATLWPALAAGRAATRVLRYAPVPATRTRKAPTTTSVDRLVESLISLMEAGTTPWRREWDATTGGHHLNLLTGHRYRGSNPVLLTLGMHLRGSNPPAPGPQRVGHAGLRTFSRTRKQ
jgi:hypothetical protein